ncbi:hypothetical protein CDD82_7388 [Ophiocordyceps australis]|uniref:Cutinase n=1 Tax=Ophiocordyceps australis TaxID=1399860 RepID=A0A2C5YSY9_9HYPO|nr:hypothetical protein CDD82_7388 [Ophiocordyceps australis]
MRPSPLAALLPPAMALSCSPGLYVLVARGTFEPPGPGSAGLIPQALANRTSANITTAPIDYPASLTDPAYTQSVQEGGHAVHDAIVNYASACPDGKMAIVGYSQGAQISLDAICGGSGNGFSLIDALPSQKLDNVVAIVLFGDPSHVANTTYDRGTSTNDGIFSRDSKSISVCNQYSSRIVSYCDSGDVYCDSGNSNAVHHGYLANYTDAAVDFILDRFHAASNSSAAPSPLPTTSSSSPSSTVLPVSSSTAPATSSSSSGPAPSKSGLPVVSLACSNSVTLVYLGLASVVAALVLA